MILCYWAVYHISLLLSEDKKTAKRSLIIMALSMPAFFLFEFSWGLYDTVWLAFLLIGIWQLIKGTKKHIMIAVACFAIAVTLKMFVLFLIVPILCYKIKNIGYLILSGLGTMSFYVLELFLYRESDYFINNVVNPLNGGFLFNLLWGASINGISVFLTIFLIACIYGYVTKDNHLIGFIYIPFVTGIMFAAISHQTPGWHVIYMPFLAVLISYLRIHERKICYLCNAAISMGIIIYTLTTRGKWFGETSLGAGIFGKWIFGVKNAVDNCLVRASSFYTAKLYGQSSITDNIVINYAGTVIFAVALFLCIYLYNNITNENIIQADSCVNESMIDFKERCVMYGLLLAVSGILYYAPVIAWAFHTGPLDGSSIEQELTDQTDRLQESLDIHCSIDYCNGCGVVEGGSYSLTRTDESVVLEGWAGNISTMEPADSIKVVCNNTAYDAVMDIERQDVAENMDSEDLLNSGWSVELSSEDIQRDEDGKIEVYVYKGQEYKSFYFYIEKVNAKDDGDD